MEADMHNLVPAIGEINGDRSNFKFGMLEGEAKQYGAVDVEINFKRRVIEPPNYVKGNIARTYFYMRDRYGINISKQQTKLFDAWNRTDPVDDQERLRNKLITQIQGNHNPYIEKIKTVRTKASTSASHSNFQCGEKRYCKQMTSCAEAKFHLHKCGNSKLDRDKDGTPCESLCK
jgi:deoxyribonuclease-1